MLFKVSRRDSSVGRAEDLFGSSMCGFESWPMHKYFLEYFSFFSIFKGQKRTYSTELNIPDYGYSNYYNMDHILAYANSAPRIAVNMPFSIVKRSIFRVKSSI